MCKNILNWPLGDGVEDPTGIAYQVDNLVDIFIFDSIFIFHSIFIFMNLVFQPFFHRQVGHSSDGHLDISLIKPGLKTSPSQSDRLDNSGVRTSTSHSTLSYLKQAQIPFKCERWPIALISWCVWQISSEDCLKQDLLTVGKPLLLSFCRRGQEHLKSPPRWCSTR